MNPVQELRAVIKTLRPSRKSEHEIANDTTAIGLDRSYALNQAEDLETIALCLEEGSTEQLVNAHRLLYRLPEETKTLVPDSVWEVLDKAAEQYYGQKQAQWDGAVDPSTKPREEQ